MPYGGVNGRECRKHRSRECGEMHLRQSSPETRASGLFNAYPTVASLISSPVRRSQLFPNAWMRYQYAGRRGGRNTGIRSFTTLLACIRNHDGYGSHLSRVYHHIITALSRVSGYQLLLTCSPVAETTPQPGLRSPLLLKCQ